MVGFVESFFEHREYFNSSLLDFFDMHTYFVLKYINCSLRLKKHFGRLKHEKCLKIYYPITKT